MLQPEEITNVKTIPQPEQTLQCSTGSDSEIETWSSDRAINEVFRLLPLELCPRPSEEHAPAKPLSGIDMEKCGRDLICSQNLVFSLTRAKFYKSRSQYFPTDNIPPLKSEASLLDLSSKGICSIPMKNIELWEKRARKLTAINSHADLFLLLLNYVCSSRQCPCQLFRDCLKP